MDCHEIIHCECGTANVVDLPDPEGDCTSYAGCAPAFKCWSCGKIAWRGNVNDEGFTDCIDTWDEDLSPEENLKEADYEQGRASETFESNAFEKFLDYDCSIDPSMTWRGFFLQRLFFLNSAKDVWAEKRPRRLALVEELLDASDSVSDGNIGIFRKKIAKAFNQFADKEDEISLDCQKRSDTEHNKGGGWKVVGIDWEDYKRTLKELIHYMMGIK